MFCRPVPLVGLAGAADGKGVGGDILGDDAAGSHIGSLAHGDWGHQGCVAANEGVLFHGGAVLFHPVEVDRGCTAAEVAVFAHVGVAQIGQMGDEAALAVVDQFSRYAGQFLGNVCSTVDPEVVVIGGGVSKAGNMILDGIEPEDISASDSAVFVWRLED